ncbi:ribonuclease HII [Psychrobacter aestuarii]
MQPEAIQDFFVQTPKALLPMGIDEAGRGPLLGSVTVAAAILPAAWSGLIEESVLNGTPLSILTDSKKLSEKKRDMLYPLVQQHALGYVVADVPAAVIDQINILQATMLGMRLVVETLIQQMASNNALTSAVRLPILQALFDGNRCPDLDAQPLTAVGVPSEAIVSEAWVKGDARHSSIAAASILAKVSRDAQMYALAKQHPEYAIDKHKGYPTRAHLDAIDTHGVLDAHRRSFGPIKRLLTDIKPQ